MTICFVTNGINRTAGTERVIVQLAKVLEDVVIIVPGTTDIAFPGLNDLKIISAEIGDFPHKGKLNKIIHRIKYLFKLKNIIKSNSDIIITFSLDLNILNIFLSKQLNFRSIVCEHIEYNYHKGIRNILRKFFYRQKNVSLVCLTETDKFKFQQDGIKTILIPNFVHPVTSQYSIRSKKILSVGRLEYQKNFSFLIDAFTISKVYEKGWILEIVGEGSEQTNLEIQIKKLDMEQYIHIQKFTKNIGDFYKQAGLMCMTSRFEAFPMVLLEAMNNGLPVLVTNFPTGAEEILRKDNPQIVQKYDPTVFAEFLLKFCQDDNIRNELSMSNLQLIQNYYPEKIVESWQCLVQKTDI